MLATLVLRISVDRDAAGFADLDAHGVEAEAVHIRLAAGGEHHEVGHHLLVVRELDVVAVLDLLDGGDRLARDDPDAAHLHLIVQMFAHVVIEAAQDILAAVDQRHLGTETVEDTGKLDGDIAAALDEDALGQFGEVKRLIRRDDVLEPGDARAVIRRGAGGDQNGLRAHPRTGRQPHRVRVLDHCARLHKLNLVALERGGVGRFQPRDLAVLVGDQRRPMESRRRHAPAVTGGVLEIVGKARGVDQELLRHAAANDAGAADAIFLGDHHPCAVAGGDARRAHAARTGANNEEIDVVVSHRAAILPAASRSKIVPPLLQFRADSVDDFVGQFVGPVLRKLHA